MSLVSCYDETSTSRTRLEDENGRVHACLGCFGGAVLFHNEELGAIKLKDVFEDPSDQLLGTSMLLKGSKFIFAFVGFMRGGVNDHFHAWCIDECTTEICPPPKENKLRAFGAAHVVETESDTSVWIACGLGLKTVRVFEMKRPIPTEPFTITIKGTVNSRASVTALGFDGHGQKIIARSGEHGLEDINVFEMPSEWSEDAKYKFSTTSIRKQDLTACFGCERLAKSFLDRDHAFRNPKMKNDHLSNWESVFPIGRAAIPVEVVQDSLVEDDSFEIGSSTTEASSPGGYDEQSCASPQKKQRVLEKSTRIRPGKHARGSRGGANQKDSSFNGDLIKYLSEFQKQINEELGQLRKDQRTIMGSLAVLRQEQRKVMALLESSKPRSEEEFMITAKQCQSPLPNSTDFFEGKSPMVANGSMDFSLLELTPASEAKSRPNLELNVQISPLENNNSNDTQCV